ncbi:hypothetical protein ACPQUH_26135, partial [Klebsiella pneumoniae]
PGGGVRSSARSEFHDFPWAQIYLIVKTAQHLRGKWRGLKQAKSPGEKIARAFGIASVLRH